MAMLFIQARKGGRVLNNDLYYGLMADGTPFPIWAKKEMQEAQGADPQPETTVDSLKNEYPGLEIFLCPDFAVWKEARRSETSLPRYYQPAAA